MCVRLTSDNGQLCSDRHLSFTVACHTLVDVLISGCSERLDPQHSTCTLIKLYGLDSHKNHKKYHISHSGGNTWITIRAVNYNATCQYFSILCFYCNYMTIIIVKYFIDLFKKMPDSLALLYKNVRGQAQIQNMYLYTRSWSWRGVSVVHKDTSAG